MVRSQSARQPLRSLRRENYTFVTLVLLLCAAFLFGGSSRDDVLSLVLLRPIGVAALAIGLIGLSRDDFARYPALLFGMIAMLALVLVHLMPLPPAIWAALPGRDLAVEAGRAGGSAQPWRPIALVPWRAVNAFFALLIPAATLVLAVQLPPERRSQLALVVLALLALSILVAVAQVASGYASFLYIYPVNSVGVPIGLFANRNHFAVLIAALLPLVAVAARDGTNGQSRRLAALRLWIAAVGGIMGLLILLMTGSRSGLVLAVFSLALLPFVISVDIPRNRRKRKSNRRGLTIALAVAMLLSVVALAVMFGRSEAINRLLGTASDDELRWHIWGPIANLAWQYFPVGSGIGSFVEVYQASEPTDLLSYSYVNHAHQDVLEWLLETGLVGGVILLAALVGWCRRAIKLFSRSGRDEPGIELARSGAIAMFVLGLASLSDYPLRAPAIACVFVICAMWMSKASSEGMSTARRSET